LDQTVELYDDVALSSNEANSTLHVPFGAVKLKVDGKPVNYNRWPSDTITMILPKGPAAFAGGNVYVRMLPGVHDVEWSFAYPDIMFIYRGSGTLYTKTGKTYDICFSYRTYDGDSYSFNPNQLTYQHKNRVKDYATWIEESETKALIVGERPSWAKSR
jgi:hypothetical protein